jgi:hypothetical protein
MFHRKTNKRGEGADKDRYEGRWSIDLHDWTARSLNEAASQAKEAQRRKPLARFDESELETGLKDAALVDWST